MLMAILHSELSSVFFWEQNKMKLVFTRFSDNLLALNHSPTNFSSILIVFTSTSIDLFDMNTLVSSANMIKWRSDEAFEISFTYIKNSRGPNIEPCGTPHVMSEICEICPLYGTHCLLFLK